MADGRAPGVPLAELVAYLDAYLRLRDVPDYDGALNGLQVENHGTVDHLIAAVDASQRTIDGVIRSLEREDGDVGLSGGEDGWAPLLLVHHGLFWDGNQPLAGRRYRRLKPLLDNDVAVYAAHLPLDAHPEVGNNAVLARLLGLEVAGWWGAYKGVPIAVRCEAPAALGGREALGARLQAALGLAAPPMLIPGGPERPQRVGILTGGGGSMIAAARAEGIDTFITGEGAHHTYFDAMEHGVNVFYAGHYATETVGVRALAEHLGRRFGLPHLFHDHPTGL